MCKRRHKQHTPTPLWTLSKNPSATYICIAYYSYTVRIGYVIQGSSAEVTDQRSLLYQMFWQLTAAFISDGRQVWWKNVWQLEIIIRRIRVIRVVNTRGHHWWMQEWATSGVSKIFAWRLTQGLTQGSPNIVRIFWTCLTLLDMQREPGIA